MAILDVEIHKDITTIQMKTDITIHNVETVEEILKDELKKNPKILGINLSEVNSIDSSSIAMLVRLMKESLGNDNKIILYGPNPEVKEIFKIVKLHTFFKIMTLTEFHDAYL